METSTDRATGAWYEFKMDDGRPYRSSNVRISIRSFHRIVDKDYTVYEVNVAKPGGTKIVSKRYSEFYKLNKILKEKRKLPRGIEFPPKIIIPSTSTKEERCRKLEKYMQILSDQDPIPTEVQRFLGITVTSMPQQRLEFNEGYSSCDELLDDFASKSTHQPVMGFLKDPFVGEQSGELLSDTLLHGVLDALYEDGTM